MCNRYRMTAKQADLAARYGIATPYPADVTIPPPELFPDRPAYVVREEAGARVLDTMSWGFPHRVPGKTIDKATGKPRLLEKRVTNVRNLASPFWRSALIDPARRCLVPFTAFSEYGPGPVGAKPLWWFDVPSRPIASFAGVWRPSDKGAVFAFLTTEPNELVRPIHSKAMPVILEPEDEAAWLQTPAGYALELVSPFPSQLMRVEEHQAGDGRDLIEAVTSD